MNVALETAKLSKCNRKKVGAVLVSSDLKNILSFGYNGTVSGFDNCCEDDDGVTKREVLHAESNAITKMAKSTESTMDSVLFITLSPCFECAKLIIQSGIKMVIYNEEYRDVSGIELLIKAGIAVLKFDN